MSDTIIYPIINNEGSLPIIVKGIGIEKKQGHVIRKNGYSIPQIILCTKGEGILIINEQQYKILPQMCFYLPSNCAHEYYANNCIWETHWITFCGSFIDEILNELNFTSGMVFPLTDTTRLEGIFRKILATLKIDKLYGGYLCSGLIYEYLLEIFKCTNENANLKKYKKNHILMPVLELIETIFTRQISLEELAEEAHITPQHLCRVFKENIGIRPYEYIAKRRIQEAKRFLADKKHTIADIAKMVGYNDCSYFGSIFKKYERMTPSEFRTLNNNLDP
jgi:AraC-like DNA-binding protein